jgi:hypothetical protein
VLLLHFFSQLGFLKDIWHKDCKHVSRITLYALRCVLSAIFTHCHDFDYAHFWFHIIPKVCFTVPGISLFVLLGSYIYVVVNYIRLACLH